MKEDKKWIVRKYLENTLSKEEQETLEKWILDPKNKAYFKKSIKDYYREHQIDVKKAFTLFEGAVKKDTDLPLSRKGRHLPIVKYAAIFVGLLVLPFGAYKMHTTNASAKPVQEVTLQMEDGSLQVLKESEIKKIATHKKALQLQQHGNRLTYSKTGVSSSKEVAYNTLKVPYGKRFQIQLSDGSLVYLNAGSSLKYPEQFIKGLPREVFLEGEGYFKVSKDKTCPFIVRTPHLSTKVFGTQFNVSSYADDENQTVVLVEGSVGVYKGTAFNDRTGTKLKPNEMALTKGGEPIEVAEVDTKLYTAWIEGTLFFKNESFASIIKKLERHYNISISNHDAVLDEKRFTGTFNRENIEQVLNTFQRTNKFSYKSDNNRIIINP